ncbi:MAG: CheR family methyltransferase [Pseudomonadota bacterium]
MTPQDQEFLSALIKKASGIVITPDKSYLLENRLTPIARAEGLSSLDELISKLRRSQDRVLFEKIIDAMTTNETFFFRDKTPFTLMEEVVLPQLVEKRGSNARVRMWTAAASSGQELYSIAMLMREMQPKLQGMKAELIGTDLSKEIIEKAKAGLYTQFEVQRGLPVKLLVKNFQKEGEMWRLKPEIRAAGEFKILNLLSDFRTLRTFDVIFCRNVLIYFDPPTKRDILERIARQLAPDGYLFLGASETVMGITDVFRPVKDCRGLYELNPDKVKGRAAA